MLIFAQARFERMDMYVGGLLLWWYRRPVSGIISALGFGRLARFIEPSPGWEQSALARLGRFAAGYAAQAGLAGATIAWIVHKTWRPLDEDIEYWVCKAWVRLVKGEYVQEIPGPGRGSRRQGGR